MPSDCDFEFDKPNGVYNSGEAINGNITLRTANNKTIRGVSVTISGFAKVRWTESKSYRENGKTVHRNVVYSAHDQYLNSVAYVMGAQGGSSFELPAGIHNHTFRCFLPSELPTSCEGKYGQIRYEVIVTIDRPYMFDNVFKQAFTVIKPLNLNMDPSYKQPQEASDESSSCCCCCCCCLGDNSAPVKAVMNIPFTGYAPGQKIPILLKIDNESNEDIDSGKVKLKKRIIFQSRSPSVKERHDDFDILSETFPAVLRLTKKEFKMTFELPSIPPSTTSLNQCVRIEYILSGFSPTACCRSNLTMSLPITIGTVPLYESATNPANIILQQPTAPMIGPSSPEGGNDLPPSYDSMVPPAYEDAVKHNDKFEDDENDKNHKEMPFVPKYPVYYNFVTPPTAPPSNGAGLSGSSAEANGSRNTANYGWSA